MIREVHTNIIEDGFMPTTISHMLKENIFTEASICNYCTGITAQTNEGIGFK